MERPACSGSGLIGLTAIIVDNRVRGLIHEVAGRDFRCVLAVTLHEEVLYTKEVVHDAPIIGLADGDVRLVLVVLQAGVELAQVLILQGVIGVNIIKPGRKVIIEVWPKVVGTPAAIDDLVLTDG